jgi:hypothetical protein
MRLILSPEGIDYSTGLRRYRYGWGDVADVSCDKFDDGRVTHYTTVLSLKPTHNGTTSGSNVLRIQERGWELSPEDLVGIVKEMKDRWGQCSPQLSS